MLPVSNKNNRYQAKWYKEIALIKLLHIATINAKLLMRNAKRKHTLETTHKLIMDDFMDRSVFSYKLGRALDPFWDIARY